MFQGWASQNREPGGTMFPFKPTFWSWLCSFLSTAFYSLRQWQRLAEFQGEDNAFSPLRGKVMEEHLESKTLMQPAICIKYNFPQSAIWPHNTHSFHLLTFPSKSIKFLLVMVGELCQACSKPKTQAPFFRELEWECDRGQKTSWGQGTYMKGQLGCLGHMFHGCLRVWGN